MKCSKCGIELTSENWYKFYQKVHRNRCKVCEQEYQKEKYHQNPELWKIRSKRYYLKHKKEIREKSREWHKRRRLEALIHYGGDTPKCSCCSESHIEFLTVDHIDGHGNQHRKEHGGDSSTNFYLWLEKNNYPKGFQVLCWNCNCSKGIYGFCPHNH